MQIVRTGSILFGVLMALIVGVGVGIVGARTGPYGGWLGLVPALVLATVGLRKPIRRWIGARKPFPPSWRRWIEANILLYRRLGPEARRRFERDVLFVMKEWQFEGVGSVEATDELRLAVAAGIAVLLMGRPRWEVSSGRSVLFYPDRFDEDYFEGDHGEYDGMAHHQGPVILSEKAVREGWAVARDGSNVVLHELAHVLEFDQLITHAAGGYSLSEIQELVRLEMSRARLGRSVLRRYAATNEAELFAVAVEVFFERPVALYVQHRELYDVLRALFNVDPRSLLMGEIELPASEEAESEGSVT